jgi:hypothetical protein
LARNFGEQGIGAELAARVLHPLLMAYRLRGVVAAAVVLALAQTYLTALVVQVDLAVAAVAVVTHLQTVEMQQDTALLVVALMVAVLLAQAFKVRCMSLTLAHRSFPAGILP